MTKNTPSILNALKDLLDYIEDNNVTDVHKVSPWLTNVEDYDENEHTDDQRSTEFSSLIRKSKEVLNDYKQLPYAPSAEIVKKFS